MYWWLRSSCMSAAPNRASGSRTTMRLIMSCASGLMPGGKTSRAFKARLYTWDRSPPANGGMPVNTWKMVQPSDHVSDRKSEHLLRMTSGAMKFGVPTLSSRTFLKEVVPAPLMCGFARSLAVPKSASFASPPALIMTFSAFRSRCTICASRRYATASNTWERWCRARWSGQPTSLTLAHNSPASHSSSTMYAASLSRKLAYSFTMPGWLTRLRQCSSIVTSASFLLLRRMLRSKIFSANLLRVALSTATKTVDNEPSPNISLISKSSARRRLRGGRG
mmetsp:Transcript_10067/g.23965  ORF Transcript_10067/g.23965 Transcript_10067/m.23965 type:complete len:278 (-) Transcript_10067:146-979(-)